MASKATHNIATHILDTLTPPINSSSYVLDNAAGTGIVSAVIKMQQPHAHIKAVDLSPNMLETLKIKMEANNWTDVETEVLDVRDLKTLHDKTFSHIITNMGFAPDVNDMEGPLKAAKEMWRVLKPGGVAVVTTWIGKIIFPSSHFNKQRTKIPERNFTNALVAAQLHVRPSVVPYNWPIPDEWTQGWWLFKQLEEAGLGGHVEVRPFKTYGEASSMEEKVGNMMLFKDLFFAGYTEEELARVPAVLAEELRKLPGFEEKEGWVGMSREAWIGIGWKSE